MKILKCTLLILALVFASQTTQAQFLKKLVKKAGDAAEETIIRKAEEKASEKAAKSFDKTFNMELGGKKSVDPKSLPGSYNFSWRYSLKMTSRQGNSVIDYFLNDNTKFFAIKMNEEADNEEALMVFDFNADAMVMLMDEDGQKIGITMNMPKSVENMAETAAEEMADYTITELDQKEILGYTCQGFKMENNEHIIISYLAINAPITFNQMAGGNGQGMPKGLNPKWFKQSQNGIMMEMQYTHKKKKKRNMHMQCITLEREANSIQVSEYQFMK